MVGFRALAPEPDLHVSMYPALRHCLQFRFWLIICIHCGHTARVLRLCLSIISSHLLFPFRNASFRTWCISNSVSSLPHSSQVRSINLSANVGYGTCMSSCGKVSTFAYSEADSLLNPSLYSTINFSLPLSLLYGITKSLPLRYFLLTLLTEFGRVWAYNSHLLVSRLLLLFF